jgi:DnaK suppressor protein
MATAVNTVGAEQEADSDVLPADYRPGADEPFMGPRQTIYFRRKLLAWKDSILREAKETLAQLQTDSLR